MTNQIRSYCFEDLNLQFWVRIINFLILVNLQDIGIYNYESCSVNL